MPVGFSFNISTMNFISVLQPHSLPRNWNIYFHSRVSITKRKKKDAVVIDMSWLGTIFWCVLYCIPKLLYGSYKGYVVYSNEIQSSV